MKVTNIAKSCFYVLCKRRVQIIIVCINLSLDFVLFVVIAKAIVKCRFRPGIIDVAMVTFKIHNSLKT